MNYLASCALYLTGRKTPHSKTPPRGGRLRRAFAALAALAALAAASVSAALPGGYVQLRSIASTGTQYIRTGILPTSATTVEMAFNTGPYVADTAFFGQSWTGSQYLFIKQGNAYKFYGGGGTVSSLHNDADARLSITEENKLILDYGGTAVTTAVSRATSAAAFNVFADGGGGHRGSWTLYSMKISTGGTLVRDFVPALRVADDAVGLYDLVEDAFHENAGTGSFIPGDIIATDMLMASSAPAGCGAPSPASAAGLAAGQMVAVSCGATPWTDATLNATYACTGWKLYDADGNEVSSGTETSFTYIHPNPAAYRKLEWQWERRVDAFAAVDVSLGADAPERRVGGTDVVLTFTNHAATSTLRVRRPVYAEVLLVGGGGGGGSNFGAGGGGGGVIHEKGVLLEPGEYTVTVGAGGAGGQNGRGATGGTTSLVRADNSTTVFSIPGGGGGGNWATAGGNGATGGGYNGRGMVGIGCGGGSSGGQNNMSGGGSVIRPGYNSTATAGGAGAPGYYCDISGENDFYGWGGGGSCKTDAGESAGGAGDPLGYGHGGDKATDYLTAGRPNHGGGGGGSRASNKWSDGGSGVVIVRYATMDEPEAGEPVIHTAAQPRIGSTSLTLSGMLESLGSAASVPVRLLYGTSPDALAGSADLGAKTTAGTVTGMVTGLSRLTDYWYCFEAAGATTVRSDVRRVKTLGHAEMTWTGLADVTTNGVYEVVSFTNGNATVTFSSAGNVDLLVVGGGGGGKNHDSSACAG
ncbi:MAG: hypothetical protein IJQ73_16150, partial [Kiritimatiellae bacterium]|nr:hypothetical protein [Kiritimatiellia bacterium]